MTKKNINGILNIDKPPSITSMDVVRVVKRLIGAKKVGHAGTLDPLATGVLPICIGQATRLVEHMVTGEKIYRGRIELGITTDSYDSDGRIIDSQNPSEITRKDFERVLQKFVGEIDQLPPMFSAVKYQGKRLYQLAREGIEVARQARKVNVISLHLIDWAHPSATIEITCGKGFYMRTLAHDIGQELGCGAHLSSLTRIRGGPFEISTSISLSELEELIVSDKWLDYLEPPDAGAKDLRPLVIDNNSEKILANGQPIAARLSEIKTEHAETRRLYAHDGRFVAIARYDRSLTQWKPIKVFDLPVPSKIAPEFGVC